MEMFLSGRYRTLVVRLFGELDDKVAGTIRGRIDRELAKCGAVNVAFDMEKVAFMDSAGIGVIMGRCRVAGALGGKVIVYNANEYVRRIIKMSGILSIITMADTLEDAMKEAAINV